MKAAPAGGQQRTGAPGAGPDKDTNLWLVGLVLSLCLNFACGLTIVWFSTQRTNMGYELGNMQTRLLRLQDNAAKLEVQRDMLLFPYNLERKARGLGMRGARPGEIRRME